MQSKSHRNEPQETFQIVASYSGTHYKMTVAVMYNSDQVMRFVVKGGGREIHLEKRLLERQPWKITKFVGEHKAKKIDIGPIVREIELYFNPPGKWTHWKND